MLMTHLASTVPDVREKCTHSRCRRLPRELLRVRLLTVLVRLAAQGGVHLRPYRYTGAEETKLLQTVAEAAALAAFVNNHMGNLLRLILRVMPEMQPRGKKAQERKLPNRRRESLQSYSMTTIKTIFKKEPRSLLSWRSRAPWSTLELFRAFL